MLTFVKSQFGRLGLLLIGASVAGVALVSFSLFSPAFSSFTAQINNTQNTIGSGTLLMTETQGATTCLSSAAGTVTTANSGTCAINKFGGSTTAVPGIVYTSTVTIKNNGTVPANTFTVTPGGCTVSANGATNGTDTAGFCGKVDITIADTTGTPSCVYPVSTSACAAPSSSATLSSLGTTAISLSTPLAGQATRTYTFSVMLDNAATNDDQGLLATDTLKWSFAS